MEQETSFILEDEVVVPESPLLRRQNVNRHGSVPGLDDEELADPDELERQVYLEEFGPVLALPFSGVHRDIRPAVDETGGVDWGAFGTVDFDSYRPQFDKLRYKTEKLREKLKDLVFIVKIMSARIPGKSKFKILKLVRTGVLDIGDIVDCRVYYLAEMYLRAWRMREQIERLQERRKQRHERELRVWLAE